MFEEDTTKVLPLFKSIEDEDTVPEDTEGMGWDDDSGTSGSGANQPATQYERLAPNDFHPHLNLLKASRV